ncbi:DNA alkylation repair protein [Opitutales bacterium ASA1]|uniref:DNA alkylation repair protein n=1 Tax=Congregicoccus parvus TaxID=3081749 RepID=UPI002B2A3FF2|nr:DNA alkylation repair protein [Opitutales bacterium ASA1]
MSTTPDTEERKPFKDWFDRAAAEALAAQVAAACPAFDRKRFVRDATRGLADLEFHGRVQRFSDALAAQLLPLAGSAEAVRILARSLPPILPDTESVTDGWRQWPLGQFIADHGVADVDASMEAMIELTQRFSSEFAVRPFIETHPQVVLARLLELTSHPSPHVRRWCSEGTRTRLPWGRRLDSLVRDPAPLWPILEALKDDPELYVRRSVANNLNDIAKDHPGLVVDRCRAWLRDATPERAWIVKRALRTLVKAGDPAALALFGVGAPERLRATLDVSPTRIAVGSEVALAATIANDCRKPQKLVIDYVVHYVRQRDKTSGKVFKWTTLDLAPGATVELRKRHPMRPTTIRALYPGEHRVDLQINGHALASGSFSLR